MKTRWLLALLTVLPAASRAATSADAKPLERRLHVSSAESSSYLINDWNKFQENYLPLYVGDDDPKTAWTLKTEGIGEWLRVHVTPMAGATKVRLKVRNGYQKSDKLWAANSRAHGLTVVLLPSKKTIDVDLTDAQGWQELAVEQPAGPFEAVELRVRSVFAGKKYDDLCLSDVEVFVTATTPDNPAFEKQRLQKLLDWKKDRLAAAKLFQSELGASMPIASQYVSTGGDGDDAHTMESKCRSDRLCWMGEQLARRARAGKDADVAGLKLARELAAARFASLTPVKLSTRDKRPIPQIDGVCIPDLGACSEDSCINRLPMPPLLGYLDAHSLLTTEQTGLPSIDDVLASKPPQCKRSGDSTFAYESRDPPAADGTPGAIRTVLLVRCGMVEGREGLFSVTEPQLLVYSPAGTLDVLASANVAATFVWTREGGNARVASARVTDRFNASLLSFEAATAVARK
jgi:hypothetical protein